MMVCGFGSDDEHRNSPTPAPSPSKQETLMNHPASPSLGHSLATHPGPSAPRRPDRLAWLALALGACLASDDANANEVTDWNTKTAALVNDQSPMEQSRSFAIVQLAVHDALNAIERRYAPYSLEARARDASPAAAVAAASHGALTALVPTRSGEIDAWYADVLAALPDGDAKTRGIDLGRHAAEHLLALRGGDDVAGALVEPYVAGNDPGDYQATPPFDIVVGAGWGKLPTFATPRASAFRPAPPPALDSRRYSRDYEEVKAIGAQASGTRSAEQTQIADFWYESSATGWLRIANIVATEQQLDAWDSARVLALVSMALADGFINGFDAKYHFDYWRPITAIRAGDSDGNRRTDGDPTWTPYCATPPVADYPSTHSVLGAAAAAVLARQFGDRTTFEIDSLSLPGVTRRFESFSQAARENADSRVYCGIHWRTSTRAGVAQGQQIGEFVFEHELARSRRR